jgi:hypothetical protein
MPVQGRFLFSRPKADIELDITSARQHPTQHQRTNQTGIDPAGPTAPPRDCPGRRQFHALRWLPTSTTAATGNAGHDVRHRRTPNPLCMSRQTQGAQKEPDVDRIETGSHLLNSRVR